MNNSLKKGISLVLVALVLGVAAYGSYLPLRKAQMFIDTLQGFSANPPSTIMDLETRLGVPLDYPGPIGQEELVRNTANSVLGLVQRSHDATTTAAIVAFLDTYYNPVLARGRGMSFGQDLYLEGAVNEIAFAATGGANYILDAKKYYEEAVAQGPNRPQGLYGLFDVYRALGDVSGTERIATTIIGNWDDKNVAGALTSFIQETSAKKPTVKTTK